MKQIHDSCLVVFGEYKRILERHNQFLVELTKHRQRMPDYGSIQVVGSGLKSACYGVDLDVVCRAIAVDGHFAAFEYAFYGTLNSEKLLIHSFYLSQNGVLYHDKTLTKNICDYNNSYLPENVVASLAAAFLQSSLVAATS